MTSGRRMICVLTAALALFVVGGVFHLGVPAVAPGLPPQYADPALFRPWAGWTRAYMLIHPLWFGAVFAAAYLVLQSRGALPLGWRGGLLYGLGVFAVGGLPVYLLAFASFRVSTQIIASWVAQAACQYLVAGAAVGAVAGRA